MKVQDMFIIWPLRTSRANSLSLSLYIYIYICARACVCICVCVCDHWMTMKTAWNIELKRFAIRIVS